MKWLSLFRSKLNPNYFWTYKIYPKKDNRLSDLDFEFVQIH